MKGKQQPQKSLLFQNAHLATEGTGQREATGTSSGLPPTFVGIIQLEDVRVLRIVRQLHHPAHDRDLLARCGFILQGNNSKVRRPSARLGRPTWARQASLPSPPPFPAFPPHPQQFTRQEGPAQRVLSWNIRAFCLCPATTWLRSTGGWILRV